MYIHSLDTTQKQTRQSGFTIVELMIALSVLATLLVISTAIMIQLGKLYSKGVNEANTQNTARNIMNDLSSQLQLSGNTPILDPGNTNGVLCLGTQRYTYYLNNEVTGDPASHGLWRDTTAGNGACPAYNFAGSPDPLTKPGSGVELIPQNMRLVALSITSNSNNTYGITVTIAYGDDDLMFNSNVAGDNTNTDYATHHAALGQPGTVLCKGQTAQEFCAVSSLSITVAQRIVQ